MFQIINATLSQLKNAKKEIPSSKHYCSFGKMKQSSDQFTEGLFFTRNKQKNNPLVKKGLNYTMMTNNAIKKLSGSLVFTQELSEAEMCK